MRWIRRILLGGLVVGLILASHYFVQHNEASVALDLAVVRFENVSLWLLLLVTFAAGFASAAVIAIWRGARLRLESRRYRKEARNLEAEVHELRTLPLAPAGSAPPAGRAGSEDGLERGS